MSFFSFSFFLFFFFSDVLGCTWLKLGWVELGPTKIYVVIYASSNGKSSLHELFFLFMSDAHHGINSSTQKYQSTQSSVVLTSCCQDSGSPPF